MASQMQWRPESHSPWIWILIYAVLLLAATIKVSSMPIRSLDAYFYSYLASGQSISAFKHTPGLPHEWQAMSEDVVLSSRGFFTVKPLFIALTRGAIHLVGVLNAPFLISSIAYFFLGWVLWFWLRGYGVSAPWRLLAASLLMFSSVATDTARKGGPDMLCTLLLVGGACLLLSARFKHLGALVLLTAVFARTDSLVFAGLLLSAAAWRRQVSPLFFSVWSAAMLMSEFLVARQGYSYSRFVAATIPAGYLYGLVHDVAKTEVAIYAPFVLLAVIALKIGFQTDLVFVCLGSWVIRYLLLPHIEERYLLAQAMILGIVGAGAVLGTEHESGLRQWKT
jgi:hypothetical protein